MVSTHSRPKAAGYHVNQALATTNVSTHSRPKAAGLALRYFMVSALLFQHTAARRRLAAKGLSYQRWTDCFNTQPPEGGWDAQIGRGQPLKGFNTQPPEGGWAIPVYKRHDNLSVSTHSRPKAAEAVHQNHVGIVSCRFQHTAARRRLGWPMLCRWTWPGTSVSTHSRPKAAGASLKSLAPSGFAALISLSSQEKREREYNTAFFVTPAFTIS